MVDTDPDDTTGKLKVMLMGHADKIRMQVRHIGSDGKIYLNSDSFLHGNFDIGWDHLSTSTLVGTISHVVFSSAPPHTRRAPSFTSVIGYSVHA